MGRRRLTLTTRGAVALGITPISALAGLLLGAEELVLLSLALLTLFGCGLVQSSYRASRARGDWRVSVDLASSDAEVDSMLIMTVTLATLGHGRPPVWLEEPENRWERVGHGAVHRRGQRLPNPALVLRVSVSAAGASRFRFEAPTSRRGVFALHGLRVWCVDTFGFVAQLVATGPSATISVYPTPTDVRLADQLLRGVADMDDRQPVASALPRRDHFGDFSGIRAYVPGDRLRLLYWPALARSGELMVRDFEDSGPHRVHVLADVRPVVGDEGAESVLATVAGVGRQVLARGSVLELSTTSGERVAVGPGPLGDGALLRLLARIDTGAGMAPPRRRRGRRPLPPARREQEFRLPPGTPLVVTTEAGANALPGSLTHAHLVIAP